jgi:murein peptide amidase A
MNHQSLLAALLAIFAFIGTATAEEVTLGQSVEGRPLLARVHGPEDAPETLLIVASIHGTEPAGTPLVERLEAWMADHPDEWQGKRVVVIPVANPDGYAKGERFNVHGVDLNRNFPADNRTEHTTHGEAPLSEPESRALMRALRTYIPSRVVSLHQPIDCIDYDGPGEALAKAMSDAIDGRLPVKKLGGRPGSMGSYVGESLGKPIITVEFPKDAEKRSTDELWDDYGPALVAFVRGE